ncbi:redoxin domain-containing protein [Cystobacter fuscus]
MKNLFSAVALSLSLVSPVVAFAADTAEVGKPAPAFTLKDESGKEHSLAQYKGKIVVLEWTNPDCPFVKRHYTANTMQKTFGGYDAKKVVWLAVDSTHTNAPDKSAAWKKEKGFTYPVLQDPSGRWASSTPPRRRRTCTSSMRRACCATRAPSTTTRAATRRTPPPPTT